MLYELRTYKAAPGLLGALHARFRDHTVDLFKRHGIDDFVYWTHLVGGHNDELVYFCRFDDATHRAAAWKSFATDPDWQKVFKESHEKAGRPLTEWIDNRFLAPTDFHPADHGGPSDAPRIFEWRSYIAAPGKMPVLLDRFRNHALRKFAQHGLTSIGYWLNTVGGPNDELVYVLAFDDLAQRDQAWAAFVADEEWRAVRAGTNKDGNIIARLSNKLLVPTNYSPLQ